MKIIKASTYTGKPFTEKDMQESFKGINGEFDSKRTVCNVLRIAYKCLSPESHNLEAARALVLEAFWMGKRMHKKLSTKEQNSLNKTLDEDSEEFAFSVDWSKFENSLAQGNWD